ncbi:hypothetical protein JW851_00005 [Candidatus Woesearchaeota archaeon]|nr:hypothetical protein [Candidatus Woesearchaeota archaeon]
MDVKNQPFVVLLLIAVVSLGGIYFLYDTSTTGNVAFKSGGQKFVQSSGMTYSQPVMLCERLIGEGKIPKGYEYEAIYSEMVNRFGSNNCVDRTAEIGYWCCNPDVLGRY